MRFSLVAVLLVAAATAAPMPKNNIDIGGLVEVKRDEISGLVRDIADLLGNVKRDEISDLESEANDLITEIEAAAKAAE